MNIVLVDTPIPVITPLGGGYILYIKPNSYLENDEFCCVLTNGGEIKHFNSSQVRIWQNGTYEITKDNELKTSEETTKGG